VRGLSGGLGLCGGTTGSTQRRLEIDPNGANQPILKARRSTTEGAVEGVESTVYKNSHQALELLQRVHHHGQSHDSCGCFECIVAIVPEATA